MEFHIKQGQPFKFLNDEKVILQSLMAKLGIVAAEGLYLADDVCQLPPKKVGILKFPSRTIIINPRHQGINLNHIMRMYYFVNNASSIDNPALANESDVILELSEKLAMLIAESGVKLPLDLACAFRFPLDDIKNALISWIIFKLNGLTRAA